LQQFGVPQVLVYHMVDPVFYWGITRITPHQFEKQIKFLAHHNYHTVTLSEAVEKNRKKNKKEICLTFDDSYEAIYEYAFPVLQDHGMTATVIAISNFIGKSNAWDVIIGGRRLKHLNLNRLRILSDCGWEIGSHTSSHKDLTSLPLKKLRSEIYESKVTLEDGLGFSVKSLSYPFGQFNQRVISETKSSGYKVACGMMFSSTWNNNRFWPYNIKRRSIYLIDTMRDYRAKLNNLNNSKYQQFKERILSFGCKGTILVSK